MWQVSIGVSEEKMKNNSALDFMQGNALGVRHVPLDFPLGRWLFYDGYFMAALMVHSHLMFS